MRVKILKTRSKEVFLVPIGDLHIGERAFNEESISKLEGYIKWIKDKPNAYTILMGDLINCSTIRSPGGPFAQNMGLQDQIEAATDYFKPIKNKILGAISGNHEQRLEPYCGYNPVISICDRLGTFYFGYEGVVIFRLGCHGKERKNGISNNRGSFVGYFHHTTGGGSTVGGKMNRVEVLRKILCDADFYCGAHNHMLGVVHTGIYKVNPTSERVEFLRQMIIDTGGYINYEDSYASMKELPPMKLGSPKIRLLIKQKHDKSIDKDIHVSL
jgi:hypothetical protein